MTAVVLLAICTGVGCIGVGRGLRSRQPSLVDICETWERPLTDGRSVHAANVGDARMVQRLGGPIVAHIDGGAWAGHRWVVGAREDLEITGVAPEELVTRTVVLVGTCALGPPILWLLATMAGVGLPVAAVLACTVIGVPAAATLPAAHLVRRAEARRRHFRTVIGSFVDLVVLSLAGGVGIDGALHTASQVSTDWAAQRIGRTLAAARDSGDAPWAALGSLGRTLRIPELVELATTVQLAGTEGARIRDSLTARAASLRRHEQAEAESAANAMTERLFVPGALLLVGFLLFIGYPAFQRILGGF